MASMPTPDQIAAASARLRGDGLVGLRDIEILCDKSGPTIRREVRRGDFPTPVRVSQGRIAWPARDVRAWLASRPPVGVAGKGASPMVAGND